MLRKNLLPALFITLLLASCTTTRKTEVAPADPELQLVAGWMSGDFSNQAQHERDSSYEFMRLHVRPIWPKDKANRWFYVEQAAAAAPDKPLRQQVYKLERLDFMTLLLKVYTLPEPASYAGAYQDSTRFEKLKPATLLLREGCSVYLQKRKDGTYGGGTREKGCASDVQGAAYVTSLVIVKEQMLRNWERGFNAQGEQVWGTVNGGYDMVKQ